MRELKEFFRRILDRWYLESIAHAEPAASVGYSRCAGKQCGERCANYSRCGDETEDRTAAAAGLKPPAAMKQPQEIGGRRAVAADRLIVTDREFHCIQGKVPGFDGARPTYDHVKQDDTIFFAGDAIGPAANDFPPAMVTRARVHGLIQRQATCQHGGAPSGTPGDSFRLQRAPNFHIGFLLTARSLAPG
jgi:hypothetical protein